MPFQQRADYIKILSKEKYPPVHRSATRVHFWLQAGFRQTAWGYRLSVCGESKTPPTDQLLNPAHAHAASHGAQHTLLLAIRAFLPKAACFSACALLA